MNLLPVTRSKILNARELAYLYTWIAEHEHEEEWKDRCFLVRFVLGTGLRVSEVPALRVPQHCEDSGVITCWNTKGGKFRYAKAMPELLPHYQRRLQEIGKGLLFPRRDRRIGAQTPYSTRTLQNWWADVMKAAGMPPVSIHAGRHTFAVSNMDRLQLWQLRDLLGHSNMNITSGFYLHVDVDTVFEQGEPAWRAVAMGEQIKTERKLRVVK
jgi:integrase